MTHQVNFFIQTQMLLLLELLLELLLKLLLELLDVLLNRWDCAMIQHVRADLTPTASLRGRCGRWPKAPVRHCGKRALQANVGCVNCMV